VVADESDWARNARAKVDAQIDARYEADMPGVNIGARCRGSEVTTGLATT
jgi:hypothetical protein